MGMAQWGQAGQGCGGLETSTTAVLLAHELMALKGWCGVLGRWREPRGPDRARQGLGAFSPFVFSVFFYSFALFLAGFSLLFSQS